MSSRKFSFSALFFKIFPSFLSETSDFFRLDVTSLLFAIFLQIDLRFFSSCCFPDEAPALSETELPLRWDFPLATAAGPAGERVSGTWVASLLAASGPFGEANKSELARLVRRAARVALRSDLFLGSAASSSVLSPGRA
jgi:hypothetical protein